MPGIVGAFGVGERPTIFVSAGRIADEPTAMAAGPDSLWRVYSMTKPITAMAAMILVEEGKIKLDQPVSDFIPAFGKMRVQISPESLESRPAARPITIRNLLTHTAGLGYTIITKGPLLAEYNRLGLNPGALSAPLEIAARKTRPSTLEAFANRVAEAPLIADPGTRWSYSIGLDVMGRVIEVAGGMPFDTFVQKRIFDPLKMTSSYWTVPQSEVGRFATSLYFPARGDGAARAGTAGRCLEDRREVADPDRPGRELPSGSRRRASLWRRRAGDVGARLRPVPPRIAGWWRARRRARAEAGNGQADDVEPAPPGVTYTPTPDGTPMPRMGYGAGGSVYLEDKPDGGAKGTYGWGGAAGTIAWVDPARKARGAVMVNYFPADQWGMRKTVVKTLMTDYARYK